MKEQLTDEEEAIAQKTHRAILAMIQDRKVEPLSEEGIHILMSFFLSSVTGIFTATEVTADENQEVADIQEVANYLKGQIDLVMAKAIELAILGDDEL